jgi:hypothetical protein
MCFENLDTRLNGTDGGGLENYTSSGSVDLSLVQLQLG